jgi:hypothetical protein
MVMWRARKRARPLLLRLGAYRAIKIMMVADFLEAKPEIGSPSIDAAA